MLNNLPKEKQKLYIKFEDLDDLEKTLETFYQTIEIILDYYCQKCYYTFKFFMGAMIIFVITIFIEAGFTIKDIKEFKNDKE